MKKRMSEWNKSGEGLENMRKEGKYERKKKEKKKEERWK